MKGTTFVEWFEVISITPDVVNKSISVIFKRDGLTWKGEIEQADRDGLEVYVY